MNKCFKANWFQILGKTSWNFPVIKKYINLNKGYGNNKIKVVTNTFLGLQIKDKMGGGGNTLNITHKTAVRC